nr:MAG TPA: hypothetical protein [Caudoviricetes sp.]
MRQNALRMRLRGKDRQTLMKGFHRNVGGF